MKSALRMSAVFGNGTIVFAFDEVNFSIHSSKMQHNLPLRAG